MGKQKKRKEKMLQQNQRYIITELFRTVNETLELKHILNELKNQYGYENSGSLIRDAILEGLLYVDLIENNGRIYLGLTTTFGENTWWEQHEE
ncbi:MAG: hypothetical protein MUO82_09520 [Candidatus Thermoplasmatota archaeon]|nr:hypothetical protein [Candidatus Thermoplasmatota archaeon]